MKEKLLKLFQDVRSHEHVQSLLKIMLTYKKVSIGLGTLALVIVSYAIIHTFMGSSTISNAPQTSPALSGVEIGTAGATSTTDTTGGGSSWPGELISLGSLPVQPSREGSISSWYVHVGQKVYAGQTLGLLSRPPANPDTISMVAEKAGDAALSRASVVAKRAYTTERLQQLNELHENKEKALQAELALYGNDQSPSISLSIIAAKKKNIRAIVLGTLSKTYPIVSGNSTVPARPDLIRINNTYIGIVDSNLKNKFQTVISNLTTDLADTENPPIQSGLAFYEYMIKLANASIADGNSLTETMLTDLKTTLTTDQQIFIQAVDSEKQAELSILGTQKEAFEQLREIEKEMATLKQDLAIAEGDVRAKDTAYSTVRGGAFGSYAITAPKSGIISSITKNVGEYVSPGTPVAMVTDSNEAEYIVRFRIPSNIPKPKVGDKMHVVRPGFPEIMPAIKIIGVGNSLDETGSIMADAKLIDTVDWPIGVSVRVIASSDTTTLEVPLSAIWWDATSSANIWGVTSAGRVYHKKVTLGRTVGDTVEVYDGLKRGEQYISKVVPGITEDMLVTDIRLQKAEGGESSYEAMMRAMGM